MRDVYSRRVPGGGYESPLWFHIMIVISIVMMVVAFGFWIKQEVIPIWNKIQTTQFEKPEEKTKEPETIVSTLKLKPKGAATEKDVLRSPTR